MTDTCPIWGSQFPAQTQCSAQDFVTRVSDSPRAGGSFKIDDDIKQAVGYLSNEAKARLTTWIVDQNAQGAWMPEITSEIVELAKHKPSLPVYERAYRLLRWTAGKVNLVGKEVDVWNWSADVFAWTESVSPGEVEYFVDYLQQQGWAKANPTYPQTGILYKVQVTIEGYRHIETQVTNASASQAFVAMWFNDSMKNVRDTGIMPGIEDAGYNPYVVDEDEHIDKIDDKIIAEIRRSRFIVADFTHGKEGARGGVYFEAGFALGFGIPVLYTCRKDQLKNVHFDTRQYNHILWETPAELRAALANRIRRRLGQGPEPLP